MANQVVSPTPFTRPAEKVRILEAMRVLSRTPLHGA